MLTATKLLATGSLLLSAYVWADDAPSEMPAQTTSQKMHACMDRQRAAEPSKPARDIKKSCRAELKSQDSHPIVLPPALVPAHPAP